MAEDFDIGKVQELSDLELAALICLVAEEHCIIDTEPDAIDDLVQELQLIASKVFGLSNAVVDCYEHTTLDDFAHAILSVERTRTRSNSSIRTRQDSNFLNTPAFASANRSPVTETFSSDNKSIANVIIAKNLDEAPKQVQIQALELMRTGRIYTRTSVHNVPRRFLFIALLGGGEGPRLTKHLNDYMFISHFHDPEDGLPNLEDMYDDGDSISSVVKKSPTPENEGSLWPTISAIDIEHLSTLAEVATVSVEVKRYQQDIISFLRIHRAVAGGISATSSKHLDKLAKCLAPLHSLEYATPSLIALAARKIFPHRIHIVKPENERSMQWGSDLDAISALLEGIGAEDVIEEVLGNAGAEAPL
ncbi:hypothetical protein MBM_02815 [Drepanopeziza brunnea f. sp. 'multigermtubi' MB_m1]|uniref:Magnesium chelatase n=1 Tax=Marssonina brunnea f. sp. multigermtubi (strain MB_m1) TaxID=1072389 RepID=K1XFH4_MARBU|nr:uncharacterized protein MBM_02815 [Drepanopeziza brunnea f. sp. 'multigermtubi' MB_m1]EKD19578.1 hypothetical protein MBM_02815 [Drepanopeziza brunnea f. sp. 'multigermtubi' MB_m1]